jgi:predicted dehydrogenase
MINVAVIGVGSIGRHHARIYSSMEGAKLTAVADSDMDKARALAEEYGCRAAVHWEDIIELADAFSVAAPTSLHHEISLQLLKRGRHVLVEKPMTTTVQEADDLIAEAEKRGLVLQVGHLERFNSGIMLISRMVDQPRFIESRRLSPFLGRGIDVDVTLDLMIHDIDIILSLVSSEITDLRATGAKVLTENIDVAHAWIEFANGCVAESVTSRIAEEKVRKLKIFQHNACLDLDYRTQELSCFEKKNGDIEHIVKKTEQTEPLQEQIRSFIDCVRNGTRPLVSGYEGREALKVALRISELVNHGLTA